MYLVLVRAGVSAMGRRQGEHDMESTATGSRSSSRSARPFLCLPPWHFVAMSVAARVVDEFLACAHSSRGARHARRAPPSQLSIAHDHLQLAELTWRHWPGATPGRGRGRCPSTSSMDATRSASLVRPAVRRPSLSLPVMRRRGLRSPGWSFGGDTRNRALCRAWQCHHQTWITLDRCLLH